MRCIQRGAIASQGVESAHALALQGEVALREEAEARASLAEERVMGLQTRLTAVELEHSSLRGELLSVKLSHAQLEETVREEEHVVGGLLRESVAGSGVVQSGEEALSAHMVLLRGVEEALRSAKVALR